MSCMRAAMILGMAGFVGADALGQAPRASFEVASIKPNAEAV